MPVTQVDSPATFRDCCLVTTHSKIWIRIKYTAPRSKVPRLSGPNSPLHLTKSPKRDHIYMNCVYTC